MRSVALGRAGIAITVSLDARRAAALRRSRAFRLVRRLLRSPLRPAQTSAAVESTAAANPEPAVEAPLLDPERLPEGAEDTPAARQLWARVCAVGGWYHSIDLGHGISTPGAFDHRAIVQRYGLPADLTGKRALDVATFDGFWAFEMERRGAREVVALDLEHYSDLDLPPEQKAAMLQEGRDGYFGTGFALAREARGSRVQRTILSVYELSPERTGGTFDVVFCGDLLLHLMNVPKALQGMRAVTGGEAVFVDVFDPTLDVLAPYPLTRYLGGQTLCTWWTPSRSCLVQMIKDAGFRSVEVIDTFKVGDRGAEPAWRAVIRARP
jgi:tRNA (mo5U34)-methyltransferase